MATKTVSLSRQRVTQKTSTVLGYTARWAWDQLVWNGLEFADHGPHMFAGDHGYLHVCAWVAGDNHGKKPPKVKNGKEWFEKGGVMYRVRPRIIPGMRFRKCDVVGVEVEKINGEWHWVITFEVPNPKRKAKK